MLRKRSRPVNTTKQGLMADTKLQNPPLFLSPRAFVGFSDTSEAAMSPTSILETKPFSTSASPRKPMLESHQQPLGIGIADALKESPLPVNRIVLFGSQLKVQIPSATYDSAVDSPQSPIEFGVKNKSSQLALFSPAHRLPMGSEILASRSMSATDMEMSDDYTCVIAHGPNPRTTHIFDNCIIESCCGQEGFGPWTPRKDQGFPAGRVSGYPDDDFLSSCHACKRSLGQGKDIFMYRGEKAFCSRECRHQEMLFDEGMEDCSADSTSDSTSVL